MNTPILDSHGLFLLLSAATSVIGLILLIAVGKLNPFLSLMIVSLGLAVTPGMPLEKIAHRHRSWPGHHAGENDGGVGSVRAHRRNLDSAAG